MKLFYIIPAFFLACGFSLYAQAPNTISIYVDSTTGYGPVPGSNAYYRDMLVSAVERRHFRLVESSDEADFTLEAFVGGPYTGSNIPAQFADFYEPRYYSDNVYLFHLKMENNKDPDYVTEQECLFDTLETFNELVPIMMNQVFALITSDTYVPDPVPVPPGQPMLVPNPKETRTPGLISDIPPGWRDRWLFLGIRGLASYSDFDPNPPDPYLFAFGGGILLELNLISFLSLETGAEIIRSGLTSPDKFYNDFLVEIPAVLKFTFNPPSANMAFGLHGGVRFNFPVQGFIESDPQIEPSLISWLAGIHYEVKIGPGAFFVSPYFSKDLNEFKLAGDPLKEKMTMRLGLGYKFGFFRK